MIDDEDKMAETTENPYLNARRAWNEHVGDVVSARRAWQAAGFVSLLIALAAVGGVVYIGSQSKFVPYVIEVDKLGEAVAVQPAQKADPANERVNHAYVAAFINDARLVTPDIALQRAAIFRIYAMLSPNDPATQKMNQWLDSGGGTNPFKRAETETVGVQIETVIRQTETSWQVDWVETVRDRQGVVKAVPYRMRALVTVYLSPLSTKTSEEQIRRNPLGIFVSDYSWSKQN